MYIVRTKNIIDHIISPNFSPKDDNPWLSAAANFVVTDCLRPLVEVVVPGWVWSTTPLCNQNIEACVGAADILTRGRRRTYWHMERGEHIDMWNVAAILERGTYSHVDNGLHSGRWNVFTLPSFFNVNVYQGV